MKFFSRLRKSKCREPAAEPFIYVEVDPRKIYIEDYLELKKQEINAQKDEAQAAPKLQKSYSPSFSDGILNFNDVFVARFYTQTFVNYQDGSSGGLTIAKHHIWSINKHKGVVEYHGTGFFQSFNLRDAFFELIQSPFGGRSLIFGVNSKRSVMLSHPEKDILQDWFHLLNAVRDSISTDGKFIPFLPPLPSYQSQQIQNVQQVPQMEESFVSISELEESPMNERPYFVFLKKDQDLTVRRSNNQIVEVKIKDVDHKNKKICVYWIENEICYEEIIEFKNVCNNIPFVTSPSIDSPIGGSFDLNSSVI